MLTPVLPLCALLALLLLVAGQEIDTVFIIDGSGSIDTNEFYLQKQGVESAITNFVPEDGSHSVTLVQYGMGRTTTHLSRTVISSAADKSSAISVVQSASQIGGGTNPGDGINAATAILNSGYNSAAEQIFCLSTDGTRNSGASMSSALSSAKAASFALDGLAIVAIENGAGSVATLTNYYSPYAYNKEFMMTKANLRDFVTTFGTACYADRNMSVSLVALEVTQSVQDLNNTAVPLVQSKNTWVRAYIKSQATADPSVFVKARLHGIKSDGSSLPNSPIVADQNFPVTDPIGQRDSKSATSNFLLEESWTQQNDPITLRVEVVGHYVECVDTAVDGGCGAVVSFQESDSLVAVLYKISYRECFGCPDIVAQDSDLISVEKQLLAMFPTHRVEYTTAPLTYTSVFYDHGMGDYYVDGDKVMKQIRDAHMSKDGFAVGILGENAKMRLSRKGKLHYLNGLADENTGASATIFRPASYGGIGKYTTAHEIAHTYEVVHTAYLNPSSGLLEGICGSEGGVLYENVQVDSSGTARPIIGPFDKPRNYVFGWNSFEDVIINPFEHFALMSYCGPSYRWISDVTYKYLASALKHTRRLDESEAISVSSAATVPVLQFEVWIDVHTCDSNVVSVASRDVPSSVVAPSVQYSVNDTYFLQTYDAGNVALGGYAFTPSQISFTPLDFNFSVTGNDGTSLALVYVPYSAQIASAKLVCSGQVKAAAASSSNAPTVTVLYPNGGESILGPHVEFLWTASDADGDALTFDVSYSNDGGSTWADVAFGSNDTSVNVTVADLGKTTAGKLRVRVSDGFNNAVDESDGVFVTPNAVPSVAITSHMNSVHLYSGVQSILLQATAVDREDGVLPDSSLKWYSDLDGLIGTGQSVSTSADQFQVGTHAVTVVATDSDGDTATAGVRFVVSVDELPLTHPPSGAPSTVPSGSPTSAPSGAPTSIPSGSPTATPSGVPSCSPSSVPSCSPTSEPSSSPTTVPSSNPTGFPTIVPSEVPSSHPSDKPTCYPSSEPSSYPTNVPSVTPAGAPTSVPSQVPSFLPSFHPASSPSSDPSCVPSSAPSSFPTGLPSTCPTEIPSSSPSTESPTSPSNVPSFSPSSAPTSEPSSPTSVPSYSPSSTPSSPSLAPSSFPSIEIITGATRRNLELYGSFSRNTANHVSGTLQGVAHGAILTEDRFGNASSAYDFDGFADYILFPHFAGMDRATIKGAVTVSWWLRVRNFDEKCCGGRFPVMDSGANSWKVEVGPSVVEMEVARGVVVSCGSMTNERNVWNHFAISFDSARSIGTVYKNGELVCSATVRGQISNSSGLDLYIGQSQQSSSTMMYADGEIDEVRIYSRELTAREMVLLYTDQGIMDIRVDDDDDGYPLMEMIVVGVVLLVVIIISCSCVWCCCSYREYRSINKRETIDIEARRMGLTGIVLDEEKDAFYNWFNLHFR